MSRLPPLPYEKWDEKTQSVITPWLKGFPVPNVLGLFAHHPALAKGFLRFNGHVLFTSTLPDEVRELVTLRVAWRRRCRYEWAQHVLMAREAGVTDEEIAAVRAGADTLLNRAVDELDEHSNLSAETYRELAGRFDERQLMDLVFTVGAYSMLAMALNTFDVELDPGASDENFDGID